MIYATFLYLLLAAFVIWVWSPPAILRMLVLIVLILLYSWTSSRLAKKNSEGYSFLQFTNKVQEILIVKARASQIISDWLF